MVENTTSAPRTRCRFPLSMKLVAVLIPLSAISMAMAMWGLSTFLADFFQRRAELETARLGQAVELALRQSMLRKPDLALDATLADIQQTPSIRRVWVIDRNGRIAHASNAAAVGRVLNKNENSICKSCHAGRLDVAVRTVFAKDDAGDPVLRHVRPIENEKVCWECHDAKARLNGILVLEESTQSFQGALSTIQHRLGATGGVTLAFLALTTMLATAILVQRPVAHLITGVRQLGKGDLKVRVPVHGQDELSELASSFNGMAEDLDRSIEEIRNKNAELSVVYSILERLTKTIDLGDLKEIILQTLTDVFGADQVLLLSRFTQSDASEVLVKSRGVTRIYRNSDTREDTWEFEGSFPFELAQCWMAGELAEPLVADDRKLLCIPVAFNETSMALLLVRRDQPFRPAEAHIKLLAALSNHIGVAFENARLYTLAITDELTQLFSKRHFENRIADAVANYKQDRTPFGLLMLDLDHFKAVNDRFGHPAGDKVLRHSARVMLRSVRAGDSAYRCGGEEFAILLPQADLPTTWAVAERVRQEIASLRIPLDEDRSTTITVSIGIAVCPEHGRSGEELVAAADAALYRSKRDGRNRASGAEPADASSGS